MRYEAMIGEDRGISPPVRAHDEIIFLVISETVYGIEITEKPDNFGAYEQAKSDRDRNDLVSWKQVVRSAEGRIARLGVGRLRAIGGDGGVIGAWIDEAKFFI